MAKISATIFTGFLGAGKTTLIRQIAEQAQGKKFAFLINEFGDLGIDGQLLSDCGMAGCKDNVIAEDDVIELANGCICCTVADDFLPAIQKILAREQKIDHIIIETSGLALPKPLVKAFNWQDVKPYLTVDAVIAVVDAEAIAGGLLTAQREKIEKLRLQDDAIDHETPIEELFEEQLQCADLVILSKIDAIDNNAIAQVQDSIKPYLRAGVQMLPKEQHALPIDLLLGMGAGAEDDLASRLSHHDDGEEHEHDDFTSFSVQLGEMPDAEALQKLLQSLIIEHDILRIKGFIAYANLPRRAIVQAVGAHINHYFDRALQTDEPRQSKLVFIGQHGLNQQAILQQLQSFAE